MSFSVRQVANTCSLNLASGTPPAAGYTILRTGVTYSTVAAALAAAQNGDSIGITAGTSVPNTAIEKSLTFYCLTPGARYTVLGKLRNTDGTGTGINRDIVIQDAYFGFFKAHPNFYGGPNAAPQCFDWAGEMTGSLVMRNCVFEDCPMPVFSSRFITDCLVENCTFINCGSTDEPNTHGIYVHASNSLTVRGCTFYWTYSIPTGTRPIPSAAPYSADNTWLGIGHHIKSRSLNTYVYACLIDNRLGSVSSQIDIAEGGSATIEGNIILEGPYSADDPTIGPPYAGDTQITSYIQDHVPQFPAGPFVLRQNTIVNYGIGTERLIRLSGPVQPSSYDVRENLIVGPMADVPNANYPPSLNTITTSTTGVFVDPNANNFTPLSTTLGASNYATTAYQAVAQYISRSDAYRGGVPITAGLPAYISAHAVGEWFQVLPGTTLNSFTFPCMSGQGFGNPAQITAYSGGAARWASSWYFLKGGGHVSTLNNMLIGIQLSAGTPAWTTISPCTPAASIQSPYNAEPRYLDGKMCAGHSAYRDWYLQAQDRYVQIGSGVSYTGAGGAAYIDAFSWASAGSSSPTTGWIPSNTLMSAGHIYGAPNWVMGNTIYTANWYQLYSCQVGDLSTALVGTFAPNSYTEKYGACIVDTKRGALVWGGMLDPNYGSAQQLIRMLGAGNLSLSGVTIPLQPYGGGVYEPFLDRYLLLQPGASTVYSVDPDSGVVTTFPTTGSLVWPSTQVAVMSRLQYLPELKVMVFQEPGQDAEAGRLMMMRTG